MQGEWYGIGVERRASDGAGLFFSGWYAQAAYTLVDTPRRWKPDAAAWGSPKPSSGFDPAHGA
jgi:phosphate-selective porin OprO/OprP